MNFYYFLVKLTGLASLVRNIASFVDSVTGTASAATDENFRAQLRNTA